MTRIAAVAPALPDHVYSQADITAELSTLLTDDPTHRAVLERLHAASGILTRHTVLPLEAYRSLGDLGATNRLFLRYATELCRRALTDALDAAGLAARDVDYVLFTSVTGIGAPSVDALLIPQLGLRPDVKRIPSYGLGCVAGAAGIARVHDYLVGHPGEVGVLLAVELCSLTLRRSDASMANFVASGLFGDGAAAVVMVGDDRAETVDGPRVLDTQSTVFPDSTGVIGFDASADGFEIVLTSEVAEVITRNLPARASALLGDHGLGVSDIGAWFAHPGGPRVLEAFSDSLRLPEDALAASWSSLARVGNLSSASVLHVLADDWAQASGTVGLLFAVGPGVSAELVLLEWP